MREILMIILLLGSLSLSAQEQIYLTFLQDSAGVGEVVDLIITTEDPEAAISDFNLDALEDMQFISATATLAPGDSIKREKADFSVLDYGSWEDTNKDGVLSGEELKWDMMENGGETVYRNRLRLAFYDVGIYIFNGFSFSLNGQSMRTNRALMKVTFKDYDLEVVDSTGLAPIKNIEREPLKVQDFLPYLLYVLIPALLFYLLYRFIKKKNEVPALEPEEEVIIIPPDVKALTGLKELRGKELWQRGEIKQYQSELSHIIREYLEGRYNIHALESTTSQIIRSIKDKSFTEEDQQKLMRILQISDLVKFAKAKPDVNIHEEFMEDAIEFVQRTRKMDKSEEEE